MSSRTRPKEQQRTANRRRRRHSASPQRRYLMITGAVAIALVIGLTLGFRMPFYFAWIAALSIVLFITYGFDKKQARVKGERVPESVLHLLALAGGFPGGWLGRGLFKHKTRKSLFTVILMVSSLLHVALALGIYLR